MIDPFEVRVRECLELLFGDRAGEIRGKLRDQLRRLYALGFEDGRVVGLQDGQQHERAFLMGYRAGSEDQGNGVEPRDATDVLRMARSLLGSGVRLEAFDE